MTADGRGRGAPAQKNASVRISMLSRGRACGGAVGSLKAVCAVQRARPSLQRLVDLEDQRLVRAHAREPVPALIRVVGDRVGLADPVGIAPLVDDERLGLDGLRVADRQRVALDRMVDRPPHLDDREAALEQRLGLVAHDVAHPLRPGPFGVVVVDPADDVADFLRLALRRSLAVRSVWSNTTTRLAPLTCFDQLLAFRVVDPPDLGVVVKSATWVRCGTKRKPSRSNSNRSASGRPLWRRTRCVTFSPPSR